MILDAENVLDADGHAEQGTFFAAVESLVGGVGLGEGVGGIKAQKRAHFWIDAFDLVEARLHGLASGDVTMGESGGEFGNGKLIQHEKSGHGRPAGLLHDFWNDKKSIGLGWGIAKGFLVGERGTDLVGAGDVDQREGMSGRFDPADVDLIELFDVPENAFELRAQFFLLGGREAEPGKVGDVFDVEIRF